jgi:hypothetical protein
MAQPDTSRRSIDADTLCGLHAWVGQECAAGLASGTMVVRPAGRPGYRDLMRGALQALSLLQLDPTLPLPAPGLGLAKAFSPDPRAQSGRGLQAIEVERLRQLREVRRRLVEQWKRVGVTCWSDAAFLGLLGDLADDPAFADDVVSCTIQACRQMLADPSGPMAALLALATDLQATVMTDENALGYRIQRRDEPWLGGGIDDLS